jgi:cytoskeletal protein CcmA (bactofilin family)
VNCFEEAVWAEYVDGELSRAQGRELERHLVACRSCRALVQSLRDENRLLADVVQGREPALDPTPARVAAVRGLALGGAPAIALAAGALFAAGWLAEAMSPFAWLAPLRWTRVFTMTFDLVFAARDQLPQLFALVVSMAGVGSVAALLTFGVSVAGRRLTGAAPSLALAAALLCAAAAPAAALVVERHEHGTYHLPAGEQVAGSLVVSGDTVRIDGAVDGDLFVLAHALTLRGEVRGNVFAVVRRLEIAGSVAGSLHVFSENVELGGSIGGSVYSGSESLRLGDEGRVARDLVCFCDSLELAGSVGHDVTTHVEHLALLDTARVGGDVAVRHAESDDVERMGGAVIGGELRIEPWHAERAGRRLLERYGQPAFYLWLAIEAAGAFLFGLLLHALVPRLFEARVETAGAFLRALGLGFLALVATPIAVVVLGFTLVGIPIALTALFAFLVALYAGTIVLAFLVGRLLVAPRGNGTRGFAVTLLAGLALVGVLIHVPFAGPVAAAVLVLSGLGLMLREAYALYAAR